MLNIAISLPKKKRPSLYPIQADKISALIRIFTQMVFLKDYFENIIFEEKKSAKKHAKLPSMQRFKGEHNLEIK